jgi:EAL and modified HD-GYP domain-containing signal transduction protein
LNLKGHLFGYELLFRDGVSTKFEGDGEIASKTMVDNMILYGFRKLTAGMPAFINCTAETLTGDFISVLPSSMTVIEVLESVKPNPEIIGSCRRLKAEGYRIALDDFVYRPELEPLIRIADFIKIDYLATTASERRALILKLESFSGALLAEKVEREQDFGYVYEWIGERRDAHLHPAPGRLISVGDHSLHLLCKGSAAPAVVIEQGAGELSKF